MLYREEYKMNRLNWKQYFIAQAHIVALRSTCTRLNVGAVIVKDNRLIATGYNGSVADGIHCTDEGCLEIDGHCVRTVHAEANALLQCAKFGVSTNNTVIYVKHFPFLHCTKQLIQARVKKIYYSDDYRNNKIAEQLFMEANIPYEKIPLTDVEITVK